MNENRYGKIQSHSNETIYNSTFDEVFQEWFDVYRRQGQTTATISKVDYYFRHYLLTPELFGGMVLSDISRKDIQTRVNAFLPKFVTSREILSYANQVFKWAVLDEENPLEENPLDYIHTVKSKKGTEREIKYYNEQQIKSFEKGINEFWGVEHQDLLTLFTLLIRTGARFGEIIALKWKDIDEENQLVYFCRRISIVNNQPAECLSGLKNGNSKKIVDVDRFTIDILKKWYRKQDLVLSEIGIKLSKDDFLFSYAYDSKKRRDIYYKSHYVRKHLKLFIEHYNQTHTEQLPYLNIHGFRHTHATLLLSNGVELKQVAERLGHNDITITANIYADVTPQARKAVANRFYEIMNE